MRAGGSGTLGTRRLQPTLPGLSRPCLSRKGHEIIHASRAWPGIDVCAPPLIPEAMHPGALRERTDQLLVRRWRGRSDCGRVHEASEIPAAGAVPCIPASAAIPSLPVP